MSAGCMLAGRSHRPASATQECRLVLYAQSFTRTLGIKLRFLCLHRRHLTYWAASSAPLLAIKIKKSSHIGSMKDRKAERDRETATPRKDV